MFSKSSHEWRFNAENERRNLSMAVETLISPNLPAGVTQPFQLPKLVSQQEVDPSDVGIPYDLAPASVTRIQFSDPYFEGSEPKTRKTIQEIESTQHRMCTAALDEGLWHRRPGIAYTTTVGVCEKRETSGWTGAMGYFYKSQGSKTFERWATESIPSAFALAALSHPVEGQPVLNKSGEIIGRLDDVTSKWFTNATDGNAIRTRASALAFLVSSALEKNPELANGSWMSVACGTAIPTLQVAREVGINPKLTLVDGDERVMSQTVAIAEALGLRNGFKKKQGDVFNEEFMRSLECGVKIIDLMGIFEYIGKELQSLGVKTEASEFLNWNYSLLAQGGRMVLGQMLTDRPNLNFTLGTIGWPFIVTRTPREIMQTIYDAGIDPSQATMLLPNPGVYAVVGIDKV